MIPYWLFCGVVFVVGYVIGWFVGRDTGRTEEARFAELLEREARELNGERELSNWEE